MLNHKPYFPYTPTLPPIVCWECGAESEELGTFYARENGWEGFSRLKNERLGHCPECISNTPNPTQR